MGANLKEVRDRIQSVQNTMQITNAMKMVSAAKLRRAQESIEQLRPYSAKLNEMLVNILSNVDDEESFALSEKREIENVLMIVVTSSRGLCGAFDSHIIKVATERLDNDYAAQLAAGNVTIACIGKKGYDYFRRHYPQARIVDDYLRMMDDLSFEPISDLADILMNRFLRGRYDKIDVAFAEFVNAAVQRIQVADYLPIETMEESEDNTTQMKADYIFEPDEKSLLEHLIPSIMQVRFQRYLLDNNASEHGARMTAMDQATENAEELKRELNIAYNKARQEAITREISEIVGGAAALSDS